MLLEITMTNIESLIETNLAMVAIGHVGLVVVMLILFFNMNKANEVVEEPNEKDEEAFDYDTEQGSMFTTTASGGSRPQSEADEEKSDDESLGDPIVFNSQIDETQIPETDEVEEEAEESADQEEEVAFEDNRNLSAEEKEEEPVPAEEESEANEDPELKRKSRISEVLVENPEKPIITINREEIISDLNAKAKELLGYETEDVEGKKIDEIIFLEDSEDDGSGDSSLQKARAKKKDDTLFPMAVELEMADREFGIITVCVHVEGEDVPVKEEPAPEPEPAAVEEEEPEPLKLKEKPEDDPPAEPEPEEPEEEPVVEEEPPKKRIPLPPPPKKGASLRPLAGASLLPHAKPKNDELGAPKSLDTKTVEMFSSQLSQPLQSINQLAELISNDENAIPHLKKYAIAIQAKSNRMMSQIEEMSVLASAQKGSLEVKDSPFNLSKVLSDLVDIASTVGSENSQKITYHRPQDGQDLIALSDEEHFQKVISNLINITMQSAEDKDIDIHLESEVLQKQESSHSITYDGQDLKIDSVHKIAVRTVFPSDENINRFLDISINRTDNDIVQKLQSSGSLKNHMSSIRLMKELARSLGGTFSFKEGAEHSGQIELALDLPCAAVAEYPA